MDGFNFTERMRHVLAMAREEAVRLRHEYVGTEHMLLGLVQDREGVAAEVLRRLGAESEALARRVNEIVRPGRNFAPVGPDLPYTSRAKVVLEQAMTEARELKHRYVGTEHLLLGLLREGKGIAAQVLIDAGVNLDAARAETLRILGTEMPAPTPQPPVSSVELAQVRHLAGRALDHVEVILHYQDGGRFRGSFGSAADAASFLRSVSPRS